MLRVDAQMTQHLVQKLEHYVRLSPDDKRSLEAAVGSPRAYEPRQDIIREGDNPDHVNLVLSGWICRYKQLADGRRQIIAFLLPGDLCDTRIYVLQEMDHSLGTLTAASVAEISRSHLEEIVSVRHSRLGRALWWETLCSAAIQREWAVNLGQRTAMERLGHLFCELFIRLRAVGLADKQSFPLPLTQMDLADTTGLSPVHVNRTLQELRRAGLIMLKGKVLTIPDHEALQQISLFNPNYLHLDREGRQYDARPDEQFG